MNTKALLTALIATAALAAGSAHASILLGGFDGNQTQNVIAPGATNNNQGVKELVNAKQDAGAVGNVSTRIWTEPNTNKELQWSATNTSTATGNWGLTDFATDASTANDRWVITQQAASWINYEITNTGTLDVMLDKFHISTRRLNSGAAPSPGSPDTLTISLQQNGTFADPPVLSGPDLGDSVGGSADINLATDTDWNHHELFFSSFLTDLTLAAGETATFRIANNEGGARLYLDNIAVSGDIIPEPASLGLLAAGGLLLAGRRRRA